MKSGVILRIGRKRRVLKLFYLGLNGLGKWCLIIAALVLFWLTWPVLAQEIRYVLVHTTPGQTVEKLKNTDFTPRIIDTAPVSERPNWSVPDENYSVYIPKIAAKSNVVFGVDPWDEKVYSVALKKGVAAAAGLANPGEIGTTYMFAHSVGSRADFARYNAIFYLLHKLEKQDTIEVMYKGVLYKYTVAEKRIIDAKDLSDFEAQKTEERLVLQTCYPPGTSWKRLIIVAKRV